MITPVTIPAAATPTMIHTQKGMPPPSSMCGKAGRVVNDASSDHSDHTP